MLLVLGHYNVNTMTKDEAVKIYFELIGAVRSIQNKVLHVYTDLDLNNRP